MLVEQLVDLLQSRRVVFEIFQVEHFLPCLFKMELGLGGVGGAGSGFGRAGGGEGRQVEFVGDADGRFFPVHLLNVAVKRSKYNHFGEMVFKAIIPFSSSSSIPSSRSPLRPTFALPAASPASTQN